MNSAIATKCSTLLAVYPDHTRAEDAIKLLEKDGMKMDQLSILGQDFKTIEKPIGFLPTGSVACDGARVGAWTGGFFDILVGAAFLIVPGIGPIGDRRPSRSDFIGRCRRRFGRQRAWCTGRGTRQSWVLEESSDPI